jgi:hypothetical protein
MKLQRRGYYEGGPGKMNPCIASKSLRLGDGRKVILPSRGLSGYELVLGLSHVAELLRHQPAGHARPGDAEE